MNIMEISHRFHVEDIHLTLQSNNYRSVDYTARHIKETLNTFKGLCVFYNPNKHVENGFQHVFISLRGTVAINYMGRPYKIPIIIYIGRFYPHTPPVVFVDTIGHMIVNVSDQVDPNGRVFCSYLQHWRPDTCTLLLLCIHLQEIFSARVPLYTKTPTSQHGSTRMANDDVIRTSLISAASESLTRLKLSLESDLQMKLSRFESTRQQLMSRQSILGDLMKEMNCDLDYCLTQKSSLRSHLDSISQSELTLVESFRPTYPLHKQIFNLMCNESAIEDSIYYLGEALKRGTIQLDTYLRHVRELSRSRFKLVATIIECKNNL